MYTYKQHANNNKLIDLSDTHSTPCEFKIRTRAVKRLILLIVLTARFFNRGFNAHFVCYIFQVICVPFAGRCNRPIAVEVLTIIVTD